MFGDLDFDPAMAYAACPFEEQLEALSRAVTAGKVRTPGLAVFLGYGCVMALSRC
jgi:aryl-alcohol dehydrogenase-like predicted oxidoreductase